MPKMVYDESYGELTYAQRAAYRKYNVSPSDHDMLTDRYGDDHAAITAAVKRNSRGGLFSWWDMSREGRALV
jgi:hypothetical protein